MKRIHMRMRRIRKMKINKIMGKLTGAAAICAAVFIGMAPAAVFANTGAEADCICDSRCTDESVNDQCLVCKEDISLCQGTDLGGELEDASEAVSAEVEEPEETEDMGPLTPDGNMNIVDDYGSADKSGKQFITFTTKNGNYFYLIIDRDDNGNETVHFLNLVDESDLLSLMDEDEVKELTGAGDTEESAGAATTAAEPEPAEKEPEPVADDDDKGSSGSTVLLIVMVLAVGGGIAGYFYLKTTKSRKPAKADADPDADYSENEDDEEDYVKSIQKDNNAPEGTDDSSTENEKPGTDPDEPEE